MTFRSYILSFTTKNTKIHEDLCINFNLLLRVLRELRGTIQLCTNIYVVM